jgi:general stress protein 26
MSFMKSDQQKIYRFLHAHPVAALGTIDRAATPHIAIVYFSVDKDLVVTFTTKRQTKKHVNIMHNPEVMLLSHEVSSQTCAQITGIAEEIWDVEQAGEVFQKTLQHSLKTSGIGIPPVAKLQGDYVAYRVKPRQVLMTEFARANPSNYQLYDTPRDEIFFK